MKILTYLDNLIANELIAEQQDNLRHRELSGKLSGSILGKPLQSQILHIIGVPEKKIDPYVLRKFQRGHHVEAWILSHMVGLVDAQEGVLYRGVTGHVDALVDMKAWDEPQLGIIPHEVKSVTNAAYKWIAKSGAKWPHKLQAGMYALAHNASHYMIHYVASDDYRILSMLFETKDIAPEINGIISEVNLFLGNGIIPEWKEREKWQLNDHVADKQYEDYPAWSSLSSEECMKKLKEEYPEAYGRLLSLSGKKGGE